ncbi:hypothetical protein [Paenibacillus cisolokensis]|uniref:hypothetical protein n=1 Tax=Paenibacillus cisolokensis TaxID=1658519 RepID=UPI001BCF4052|nr:hypothetical protein [Paenibacillus cisolokensis]
MTVRMNDVGNHPFKRLPCSFETPKPKPKIPAKVHLFCAVLTKTMKFLRLCRIFVSKLLKTVKMYKINCIFAVIFDFSVFWSEKLHFCNFAPPPHKQHSAFPSDLVSIATAAPGPSPLEPPSIATAAPGPSPLTPPSIATAAPSLLR